MKLQECMGIVTGGASGLGEGCVRMLAKAGARVAIFDLQAQKGERLAAELGANVIFANCDVTSEASVQEAMQKTVDAFGGLNVAINCAGGGWAEKVVSKRGPHALATFDRIIQINLVGTFNVIRLAAEQMMKHEPDDSGERGVVINTSSAAAFEGQMGQAAYSAAKAGIIGMTLPLARDCADYGIRVMTIVPGGFATPMAELIPPKALEKIMQELQFPKRFGTPAEFASLAAHIIENQMLNGEALRLSGAARMTAK